MWKALLIAVLSGLLVNHPADNSIARFKPAGQENQTGTLEKMIVASGSVAMDIDLGRMNVSGSRSQMSTLRFSVAPNSFFTVLVFNGELRGPERGSMALIAQNSALLPAVLNASLNQLVIERVDWTEDFELVVRDSKTGFTFFNIEGNQYDYDAKSKSLSIKDGRLLLANEFAAKLGRKAGSPAGNISITAEMRAIEITQVVEGEPRSSVMPPLGLAAPTLVAGPDVIVGDLSGLAQFGSSSGTQVGLAVGTDSCNAGAVPLNWLALPNNDHPVIPQNLYRMSGGATNDQRFEQVGQSSVKHAFTALQQNICGFGCQSTPSTTLGSGCSDPYTASLNAGTNNALGSRAWINPFTGAYPRGDSATPPNTHTGHAHTGPSHRILVEMNDLNTTLNPGATYYAEAQYVTPHEYAWCRAHPGQCNMANNASFRQYSVSGTTTYTFSPVGATVRTKPAITAWTGATVNQFEPDPGNDGIGFVGYRVTNPSAGVWHYEYAVYNENLDRAIQSFSVPLGSGIAVSNTGFHAPPQHPGWTSDGTVGNAGFSSTPWTPVQTVGSLTWSSETLAQNPNANAIRWGTLYNFRFDSDHPPQTTNATLGFFKSGAPITVQVQAPGLPTLSINDVSVTEGNSGTKLLTFAVTLSSSSTDTITVQYATADSSASAASDYVAGAGTVTFNPGQVTQPVSITINGDGLEELNETFLVNLSNPVNATILDGQGVGTITNDDLLATLPSGFAETQINGLSSATSMAIHPDGRIFVCEQDGALRVIKNGALLATPFTTLTVNSSGERGLLGIAFDPNYATNRFVYVYYTATTPSIHNRVSRFTADAANKDVALAGSEVALLDLENLGATNHNGGAIHFGPDGKLYVAVGENANSANSQSLGNRLGKMLRLNADGTIPADNPTSFPNIAGSPTGLNRAIWAVGLRNPYTFSFQPGSGRMHINDVGQNTWEEINNGVAGSNYGWPTCEGTCGTAGMTNPIYQYSSATASECAITGGAFYNPTTATFPAQYISKYFFADYCGGWIKSLDPLSPPATGAATDFATGISSPVDIQVANDGSLYYLARGTNSVFRVQYFGGSTLAISDLTITEGNVGTSVANFNVLLSPASSQTVTVQYATANNTAFAGTDYVAAGGTVTFAPGETSKPASVTINGDTTFEPDETFNVNLSNATNATIGDGQAIGTIINDDAQPTISIDDVAVTEGNVGNTTATFTVSLSNTSSQTITVKYTTAGNTATSGTDFLSAAGTVTITPGLLSQTVSITVVGDTVFEPNETFFVNLTNPTNATISDNQGVGTINNDDQPSISGHLNYLDSTTGAPNVTVTLTGTNGFVTRTTTTDTNGDYTFAGVPTGNDYVVTPSRIPEGHDASITAFDASQAARFAAQTVTLTANQQTAGDSSNNGLVTAFDASQIARYELSIASAGSIAGSWKFTPASLSISNLSGNQSGQNLAAILIGDVSGNWTPSGPTRLGATSPTGVVIPVSLPIKQDPPGGPSTIPITVGDTTGQGIGAYAFDISFDPTVLQPQATPYDSTGTLSSGWLITPNTSTSGHLILNAFNTSDLTGQGVLLKLKFNVVGAPLSTSPLTWVNFTFNEGTPADSDINGSFTATAPSAAPAGISGQTVDAAGQPVTGTTVTVISGSRTIRTITDSHGFYRVEGLEVGGFYTVTPYRANYVFAPASRSFSLVGNNTDAMFTGTGTTPTGNPLESPEFFVRQQYLDFLNREPERSGLDYWSEQLRACGTDEACLGSRRLGVSAAFFIAQEFQQSGLFVYDVYAAALGRKPFYAEYAADRVHVIGGANLESDQAAFAESFVQRAEFQLRYPSGMSGDSFVDGLLLNIQQAFGVDLGDQRANLINLYNSRSDLTQRRSAVVRSLVEADAFKRTQYNSAFVLMEYFGYLHRNPDREGYEFWLNILNDREPNNYGAMVCSFITSEEYQKRFSPVVTRSNAECSAIGNLAAARKSDGVARR
ncbi:MAG: glucose/sorbosone dehydrogenase [Acidobacteria bacterium]|nr:glucose/sorbosone dehydrogenase [Acidobacteriota bacterium]